MMMKWWNFSYEEGWAQKGLIFFLHHILGQSRNPMVAVAVAVELRMVRSRGFSGTDSS